MKLFFRNMKKYYKYAIRSAKAELKSEVADSRLNWLWWIIEPLAFMLIYTFVFGVIFPNKTLYFASFVMVGQAAWDFFNRMINGSVKLIVNNRDLVTKVYIPKYILLFAKSLTYVFKMFKSYNENVHFIEQKCSICKAKIRTNGNIDKLMSVFLLACPPRGDARKPFLRARVYAKNTPKNYTYPALTDLIA